MFHRITYYLYEYFSEISFMYLLKLLATLFVALPILSEQLHLPHNCLLVTKYHMKHSYMITFIIIFQLELDFEAFLRFQRKMEQLKREINCHLTYRNLIFCEYNLVELLQYHQGVNHKKIQQSIDLFREQTLGEVHESQIDNQQVL